MSELEELELIKVFLAAPKGSETPEQADAWQNFFDTHERLVWNIVKTCASHPDDVEDIVQAVWVILVAELPKLIYNPDRGPRRAWVIVVARRAAFKEARRLRGNRADALTPELIAALIDPGPGPMTELEREQERERQESTLAARVAKLPELTRRIIELHCGEGLSVREIGAALGLRGNLVQMRLQRARKKLRQLPGAND
jgi:RNA polymerase sigma factor (sigma-70 family)